jgi:hypothetical protein
MPTGRASLRSRPQCLDFSGLSWIVEVRSENKGSTTLLRMYATGSALRGNRGGARTLRNTTNPESRFSI